MRCSGKGPAPFKTWFPSAAHTGPRSTNTREGPAGSERTGTTRGPASKAGPGSGFHGKDPRFPNSALCAKSKTAGSVICAAPYDPKPPLPPKQNLRVSVRTRTGGPYSDDGPEARTAPRWPFKKRFGNSRPRAQSNTCWSASMPAARPKAVRGGGVRWPSRKNSKLATSRAAVCGRSAAASCHSEGPLPVGFMVPRLRAAGGP